MSALGGMRRNVEVKARLRAREEALGAALRLLGLPPVCGAGQASAEGQVCPGAGQGSAEGQVCPGAGQGSAEGQVCPGARQGPGEGQVCPGAGQGSAEGQVCPGAGQGPGEGQELPQVCPGAGQGSAEGQVCPGAGRGPGEGQVCPGAERGSGEGQELPQVCPGAGQVLLQTDTFFRVPRGRLKLRRTQDGRGELIFYERPDSAGPKLSSFSITPTADPEGLQAVLSRSLGVLGTVHKERLLLLLGQTRLHLDRVQGLGDFLELEVVLRPEQSEQDGQRLARRLLRELGIQEGDLICGAYLDLLLARGQRGDSGDSGDSAPCHP